MNFEHFVCKVDSEFLLNRSAGIRYGQTIMNVLGEVWPEKYEEIIATDFDCFYVDSMAQNTLVKLEADWASRTQTGRTMMSFFNWMFFGSPARRFFKKASTSVDDDRDLVIRGLREELSKSLADKADLEVRLAALESRICELNNDTRELGMKRGKLDGVKTVIDQVFRDSDYLRKNIEDLRAFVHDLPAGEPDEPFLPPPAPEGQ